MNRAKITLAITAIVAAAALATVAFAVPQQAIAHRYNHHSSNGVKVNQQINQLNQCNGQSPEGVQRAAAVNTTTTAAASTSSSPSTTCVNLAENQADIGH